MSRLKPLLIPLVLALLSACASVPKPLKGTFPQIGIADVQRGIGEGQTVRWGGNIIRTETSPQETCFYLIAHALDSKARPTQNGNDGSPGRFVACHPGFYDPEVFAKNRQLTVIGVLHGTLVNKIGQYPYPYPRVDASTIYLWPKEVPVNYYYGGPAYYDPFWGPGWGGPWGGWGPGWGPGWGGPVYIRQVDHYGHYHGHH